MLGCRLLVVVMAHAHVALGLRPGGRSRGAVEPWIQTLPFSDFNSHFEWNSFCVVRQETSSISEVHYYKDLQTGKIVSTAGNDTSSVVPASANLVLDSRFNATTCSGLANGRLWVERLPNATVWDSLVHTKLSTVFGDQNETLGSLWIAELASSTTSQALRTLSSGAHVHRRRNASSVFAMTHLTLAEARKFATTFNPLVMFPAPDDVKLSPSAFIVSHPDAVADLQDGDDGRIVDSADEVELMIHLQHDAAEDAAITENFADLCTTWMAQHKIGARASAGGSGRVLLRLARSWAEELDAIFVNMILPHPDVVLVEARPKFKLHNQYAAAITQDGTLTNGTKPLYNKGLSGAGQIVGVGDSGIDVMSCFFYESSSFFPLRNTNNLYPNAEKVVQYAAYADNVEGESGGHGTHVAATVAGFGGSASSVSSGSSTSMDDYRGVAFDAKIAFFDMGVAGSPSLAVPADVQNDFLGLAYDAGARIHTNSWGTDINSYTTTSRDMDVFSYEHQDFLVLVAAGNTGESGFSTIGSPATAKNVLAVGASMTNAYGFADDTAGPYCPSVSACTSYFVDMAGNLASFSSLGPTFDGRMKPEVVAPGYYISSAYSSADVNAQTCAVSAKAGTSMATPATAGNAALVRQYFENDGIVPMGALIKATLIHSAAPLSDPDWNLGFGNDNVQLNGSPDTNQGYGLLHLETVLSFDDSQFDLRYFGACSGACEEADFEDLPHVGDGDSFEQSFTLSSTEGTVPLSATLVWHDPAASSYTSSAVLINDLDLTIESEDGTIFLPIAASGGTAVNSLDNTEKVQIPVSSLEWGSTYTVRVTGSSVVSGVQPFALVVTGKLTAEDIGDVVNGIVQTLLSQSGSLVGVAVFSPGVAAAISLVAFVLIVVFCVVVTLFHKSNKWPESPVAVPVIVGGAAVRIAAIILSLAALALAVHNTTTISAQSSVPLAFDACGPAGPLIVATTVVAAVLGVAVVVGLLQWTQATPLWFDRAAVVMDVVLIVLLLVTILFAAISTCGVYSLYTASSAVLCGVLLCRLFALFLAYVRLHAVDAVMSLQRLGQNSTPSSKPAKQDEDAEPAANELAPDSAGDIEANRAGKTTTTADTAKGEGANEGTSAKTAPDAAATKSKTAATPTPPKEEVVATTEAKPRQATAKKAPVPPLPKASGSNSRSSGQTTVKALYDYEPSKPDELALRELDVVEILNIIDDGWANGKNTRTGKTGMFPRNYCTTS